MTLDNPAALGSPRRRLTGFIDVDRTAMIYTADHLDDARAVFVFRPVRAFHYDHRDTASQQPSCATGSPG